MFNATVTRNIIATHKRSEQKNTNPSVGSRVKHAQNDNKKISLYPADKVQLHFRGISRDSLFVTPKFNSNPYKVAYNNLISTDNYKNTVKDWEKAAEDNKLTDGLKLAVRLSSGLTAIALTQGQHVHVWHPYVDSAATIAGGFIAEKGAKPVVKFLTRPEIEAQAQKYKGNIIYCSETGHIARDCEEIRKRMHGEHPAWLWPLRETRITQMLTGLIFPIGEYQRPVKELLPKIKNNQKTKDYVIPILEKSLRMRQQSKRLTDYELCGSSFCPPDKDVIARALDDYATTAEAHADDFKDTPEGQYMVCHIQDAQDHLLKQVPRLIEYLKEK